MKYICKDDKLEMYDFLNRTQMILIDQIKKESNFINEDKLFIIQQCLSFFNHGKFYQVKDGPYKVTIYEYKKHDKTTMRPSTEYVSFEQIDKKSL